jgi:predicted membrane metal-binding protein
MLRDPFVVMDAGAQLSFLAVCGLIVAAPFADLFGERIRQSPSVVLKVALTLLQGFTVSFIVTLVTAPGVAFHMQHLSLISPVANIPVGFLSEWALLIGAAAVTIGDIPILGKLIWTLLNGVLKSLSFVANILADVPYADVATGVANPYVVVVASVGLVGGFALLGRKLCGSAFASQPQYYIPWSPSKPLT